MYDSGREALEDLREWSGGPSECPGVVGMPSRMSKSGGDDFTDVQEWTGVTPGSPGVVGRPSGIYGSGREALPVVG